MKVNVLQVEDAKFLRKWHYWSIWVDVAVYDYGGSGFLLQMKVSRLNKKSFRNVPFRKIYSPSVSKVGDLTQMSGE